jgi:glycosyltransferase involved in cell wall biosynthesis
VDDTPGVPSHRDLPGATAQGAGEGRWPPAGAARTVLMSICICTRNRAASLARTLETIAVCHPPSAGWEIVVVDNGSSDDTQVTLAAFQDRLTLKTAVDARPGSSNARNTALQTAAGEYLVWIDDDTMPKMDWLAAYEAAFRVFPEVDLFGGHIIPVFMEPVTPWFRDVAALLFMSLASRGFGPEPVEFDPAVERIPYGANYAARAAVQRRFPIDPAIGPGTASSGEVTTCFRHMLAAGHGGRPCQAVSSGT